MTALMIPRCAIMDSFHFNSNYHHHCFSFIKEFLAEFDAFCDESSNISRFDHIYEATKRRYYEVWNDPDKLQWIASAFVARGTDTILKGNYYDANPDAMFVSFFEQWAKKIVLYENETEASTFFTHSDCLKMCELLTTDKRTIVSYFRKRIPCNCLDDKYEEVKSITNIGICHNDNCSLPDRQAVRSTMLSCTQCRKTNYCFRECQAVDWPFHKEYCVAAANMRAAQKLRQKK